MAKPRGEGKQRGKAPADAPPPGDSSELEVGQPGQEPELQPGEQIEEGVVLEEDDFTIEDLQEILDPDFLQIITHARDKEGYRSYFHYELIDEPPPGVPAHVMGFTDMNTGSIYLVKRYVLEFLKKKGIDKSDEKKGRSALRGFFRHEGGHHSPEVTQLQDALTEDAGKREDEPPELIEFFDEEGDDGKRRKAYWQAVMSDIYNASFDVWLEEYTVRGTYLYAQHDFRNLYEDCCTTGRPKEMFDRLPLHHQLSQWLVGEDRYYKAFEHAEMTPEERVEASMKLAKERLHPDVVKALEKLHGSRAIEALRSPAKFSRTAPRQVQAAGTREKFKAVKDHIYKEWRDLLVKEYEKQLEELEKQLKKGKRKLSDEQMGKVKRNIIDQLLGNTDKMGKEAWGSLTPSEGEMKKIKEALDRIRKAGAGKGTEKAGPKPEPSEQSERDRQREAITKAKRRRKKNEMTEMANRFGVDEKSIRFVEDTVREFQNEIDDLATALKNIFEDQWRVEWEKQLRIGMVEPLRITEKVIHVLSGVPDSKTQTMPGQKPDFMETEIEFMFDVSGSMGGNRRLELSQKMGIIVARAFEAVKMILLGQEEGQRWLAEEANKGRDPLRIGYSCFTSEAYRIKKPDEPNTKESLAQMVWNTDRISGGTDIEEAMSALMNAFEKVPDNVKRFMVFASDGEDSAEATQAMLRKIEKDKEMIVIILAMGANPGDVAATFKTQARAAGASTIKVIEGTNIPRAVDDLIRYVVGYLSHHAKKLSGHDEGPPRFGDDEE